MQKADIPFRTGHHFASRLTDYGRGKGLALEDIPYAEAAALYEADAKHPFPFSEREFREIISAEKMVSGRRGIGGPQPAEVERMLKIERIAIDSDQAWLTQSSSHLARAAAELNRTFGAIARGSI
jgi:argininosuccinate lyase